MGDLLAAESAICQAKFLETPTLLHLSGFLGFTKPHSKQLSYSVCFNPPGFDGHLMQQEVKWRTDPRRKIESLVLV